MNELENVIYKYVRDAYRKANVNCYRPFTEDLIIHLVGKFGLDTLVNAKLITPTENPGQYVFCCERV